jgi:hypothetical protein
MSQKSQPATLWRTAFVDEVGDEACQQYRVARRHGGLQRRVTVLAARTDLLDTVGASVANGAWLNAATAQYPAVVLGANAAKPDHRGPLARKVPAGAQGLIGAVSKHYSI